MGWKETIRALRRDYIKSAEDYVNDVMPKLDFNQTKQIKKNTSDFISKIYSNSYTRYLKDEQIVSKEVIENLLLTPEAKTFLKNTAKPLSDEISKNVDDEKVKDIVTELLGSSLHTFNEQIYQFNLSTTNSRRARSGKTFETIIQILCEDVYGYPVNTQAMVGRSTWDGNNLKKIDFLIPDLKTYRTNRVNSLLISTKTSLKERWEQIVSELVISRAPQIYLCTLDKAINEGLIKSISEHNITLVLLKKQKEKFKSHSNVTSFETLFNTIIPKALS